MFLVPISFYWSDVWALERFMISLTHSGSFCPFYSRIYFIFSIKFDYFFSCAPQIPSQAMNINWSEMFLSITFISGQHDTICSSDGRLLFCLNFPNPKALATYIFPLIRPSLTCPPAFQILSFSSKLSALCFQYKASGPLSFMR